jgi:hypothetical protein
MHAPDEFRRRNLVVARLVQVVVLLQIVVRRVVAQVRGVRVRQQAVVVPHLVAAVRQGRAVVRVAVVDQVAVSDVALAKKLVVSVVANSTSSNLKHRQVTHRVQHRRQKALL